MKKTLLTLGGIASIATPIIAVVSCGSTTSSTGALYEKYNLKSMDEKYNMKSINTILESADSAAFKSLIAPGNKEKSYDDFVTLVDSTITLDTNKVILKDIMSSYKDSHNKITAGWYVLHFAIETLNPTNIELGAMGWVRAGDDTTDQKKAGLKAYILEGNLNIYDIAQSIIDKFQGKRADLFNSGTISLSMSIDASTHAIKENLLAQNAYNAMGDKETLLFILERGTDSKWTVEPLSA